MKLFLVLITLVGLAQSFAGYGAYELRSMYRDTKVAYHMDVPDDKEHYLAFCDFADMVKKHNEEKGAGWKAEINMFALMTEAERQLRLGLNISSYMDGLEYRAELRERDVVDAELDLTERSDSVDYSDKLPPIKDQGACGSCWTFGATAALEYQVNRNRELPKALSEQQYLDCVYEGERNGCDGGWPSLCYDWTKKHNNMIASQEDYPYVGKDRACNTNVRTAIGGFKVEGTRELSKGDDHLFAAVSDSSKGVMSVAIGVYGQFSSYKSGVYSSTNRKCQNINHAVDVVGYGELNGVLYWQVRNSWGPHWGDKGHIKMKRGPGINTCAIASYAHYPVVTGSSDDDNDEDEEEDEDEDEDEDDDKKPRECVDPSDKDGREYRGTMAVTRSGRKCQRWDSQSPHSHSRTPENYPDSGLEENYCRNPDGEKWVWCYNGECACCPRWELCDVPVCDDKVKNKKKIKKKCNWKTVTGQRLDGRLGDQMYKLADAMKKCEGKEACKGVSCKSDKKCMLNNIGTGKANDMYTAYLCNEK